MDFEEACRRLNVCEHFYLDSFGFGRSDAALELVISEARLQEEVAAQFGDDPIERVMGPGRPIETDSDCHCFILTFQSYVGFSIINESLPSRSWMGKITMA